MIRRHLPLLAVLAFGAEPLTAQSPWDCYSLAYTPIEATEAAPLAATIALEDSDHRGAVVSKAQTSDSIRFWAMFQNPEAHWQAEPSDSISIDFTNGFTAVEIRLGPGTTVRRGFAAIHYDFGNPADHPRYRVAAARFQCRPSDLAGPERDPVGLKDRAMRAYKDSLASAQLARLRSTPSPVAGTWRLDLTLAGGRRTILFLRTVARPTELQWVLEDGWNSEPEALGPDIRADGYNLDGAAAFRISDLPSQVLRTDTRVAAQAGFVVSQDSAPRPVSWKGLTDVVFAASRLSTGAAQHEAFAAASNELNAVWYDSAPGRMAGSFERSGKGELTFADSAWHGDQLVFTIAGLRVDTLTLRDP